VRSFFSSLLALHLACAASGTALFWTAAAVAKGGRAHRAAGRWFARFVYLTAASGTVLAVGRLTGVSVASMASTGAMVASAADLAAERQTMWLVLYVLLIIVAPTQHGLAVIAAGSRPSAIRSRPHALLTFGGMLGSLAIIPAALLWQRWHFLVVAPLGLIIGLRQLAYAAGSHARRDEWEREHLTSMITAGVTLHTAMLVFGATRTLGWPSVGWGSWWPWMLPAFVGLPIILWQRSKREGDAA
jgi:hypothetical protein